MALRQVDERIGLTQMAAAAFADERRKASVRHNMRSLLAQRVYGLYCGWEDVTDHNVLRHDPGDSDRGGARRGTGLGPDAEPPGELGHDGSRRSRSTACCWSSSSPAATPDAMPKELVLVLTAKLSLPRAAMAIVTVGKGEVKRPQALLGKHLMRSKLMSRPYICCAANMDYA